jgi:hypothetical protein
MRDFFHIVRTERLPLEEVHRGLATNKSRSAYRRECGGRAALRAPIISN